MSALSYLGFSAINFESPCRDWAELGEPAVMWLSGLHTPETYIAALVQAASRDKAWPLDRTTLYTKVINCRWNCPMDFVFLCLIDVNSAWVASLSAMLAGD